MNILEKAKLFIWPKGENFETVINDSWKDILTYFILGGLIFAIIPSVRMGELIMIPLFFILFLVLFFVNCILVYVTAKVLGGKGSFKDMVTILTYASTLVYILGWVKCVSFVAAFIALGNEFVGIMRIFKLSLWKAVVAVLIPVIIDVLMLFFIIISVKFIRELGQAFMGGL